MDPNRCAQVAHVQESFAQYLSPGSVDQDICMETEGTSLTLSSTGDMTLGIGFLEFFISLSFLQSNFCTPWVILGSLVVLKRIKYVLPYWSLSLGQEKPTGWSLFKVGSQNLDPGLISFD